MGDERQTDRLDQNPILLGEMKLLREDLKKLDENLKKSDDNLKKNSREMRLTRRAMFGFNRDLRTLEKSHSALTGRVDVIEREVFPSGLPLSEIPNEPDEPTSDDDLLKSEDARDEQEELAHLDRIALDQSVTQSVKSAVEPIVNVQRILMRELHIDPIASEAAGESVPPAGGSKKTALGVVKRETRWSLYATAFLGVVVALSQMGVFELIKKTLLHQP